MSLDPKHEDLHIWSDFDDYEVQLAMSDDEDIDVEASSHDSIDMTMADDSSTVVEENTSESDEEFGVGYVYSHSA